MANASNQSECSWPGPPVPEPNHLPRYSGSVTATRTALPFQPSSVQIRRTSTTAASARAASRALTAAFFFCPMTSTCGLRTTVRPSIVHGGGLSRRAHSQVVMRLPPGAVLLATGATGVQAARLAPRIWGLQFHPEYDAAVMTSLLASYRDEIAAGGLDVERALAGVRPTPEATGVLRGFGRICDRFEVVAAA